MREVRLHFRFEDPAVGPVIIPARRESEDGTRLELEGAFFGLAGTWTVEVEVRRETRDDAVGSIETDVEQPGMPAWEDALSEPERWDLVNFLRTSFDEPIEASGS